jgi:hypothetical protein
MKAIVLTTTCLGLAAILAWLLTRSSTSTNDMHPGEVASLRAPERTSAASAARESDSLSHRRELANPVSGTTASPNLLGVSPDLGSDLPSISPAPIEFSDEVVRRHYQAVSMQIAHFEKRIKDGEVLVGIDLRTLAIAQASRICMEKQRYYYLGPAALRPDYTKLQSGEIRYIATGNQDTALILELSRTEFPAVFENDPKYR